MATLPTFINVRSFIIGFVAAIILVVTSLAIVGYNGSARAHDEQRRYMFVADVGGGVWVCDTEFGSASYKSK